MLSPQVQLLNNQSQLVQAASALLRSLYLIKLNTRGSPPTVSSAGMLTFQQAESCTSMAFPFHLMTASCSDLKLPVFSLHDSDGGSLGVACIPLLHQRLRESNLISTKHTLAYPTPESSATEGPLCSAFLDSAMQRLATLNISHKVACFRFESKGDTTGFIPTTASTLGSDIFPYILAGPPALACIVLQENFDRFIVPLQAGYVLPASQYNKRAKATCEENVEGTPVSLTRFC